MSVRISRALLRRIITESDEASHEVCGLLFGAGATIGIAQPCANVALDPATAFEIDPAALIAAHRAARDGGPEIVGCYHSHPSGDATPSARDAADAASNGWLWLIVGAGEGRLFRAVDSGAIRGRFDSVTLAIL